MRSCLQSVFTPRLEDEKMKSIGSYTCAEYRQEMMLLGMKRQLENPGLPESERIRIAERVRELEQQMGMD